MALTDAHRGFFQFRIASLVNGQVIGDSQGKLRGYLLRTVSLLSIQPTSCQFALHCNKQISILTL